MSRLVRDVAPTDLLHCTLGNHSAPATEFARRLSDPKRTAPAYRAYCKACHRSRNGVQPALNRVVKPPAARDPMDDEEVKKALGVLRDARAQRRGRQGYVYLMTDGTALKVGYSVKPEARVNELQTGNPREIRLLATMPGTVEDERALHAKYSGNNLIYEWFLMSPGLLSEFGLDERAL